MRHRRPNGGNGRRPPPLPRLALMVGGILSVRLTKRLRVFQIAGAAAGGRMYIWVPRKSDDRIAAFRSPRQTAMAPGHLPAEASDASAR